MAEQKNVRCAIYTRKSTDEGLDKEFNTLEAQREAGENYVRSQKHQGWVIIRSSNCKVFSFIFIYLIMPLKSFTSLLFIFWYTFD